MSKISIKDCIGKGLIVDVITDENKKLPHDSLLVKKCKIMSLEEKGITIKMFPSYNHKNPIIEIPFPDKERGNGTLQSIRYLGKCIYSPNQNI